MDRCTVRIILDSIQSQGAFRLARDDLPRASERAPLALRSGPNREPVFEFWVSVGAISLCFKAYQVETGRAKIEIWCVLEVEWDHLLAF